MYQNKPPPIAISKSVLSVYRNNYNPSQPITIRDGEYYMTTVDVRDDTNELIEDLQKKLPWTPTKKDIIGKAIKQYHDDKVNSDENVQTGEN